MSGECDDCGEHCLECKCMDEINNKKGNMDDKLGFLDDETKEKYKIFNHAIMNLAEQYKLRTMDFTFCLTMSLAVIINNFNYGNDKETIYKHVLLLLEHFTEINASKKD
jgi:hypothetical protein